MYVVGVPLTYLAMLFINRDAIRAEKLEKKNREFEKKSRKSGRSDDKLSSSAADGRETSSKASVGDTNESQRAGEARLPPLSLPPLSLPPRQSSTLFAGRRVSMAVVLLTARAGGFWRRMSKETAFLHGSFRGSCWYWEVVETYRKLLLTAVMSIVKSGSVEQIVYGIVLSIAFAKVRLLCRGLTRLDTTSPPHIQARPRPAQLTSAVDPYFYQEDSLVAELCHYQVSSVLFIALLVRTGTTW